jgi:hypothetical protein
MDVVFPKVRITDHKQFMYGDPCRRYKFLDVEKPKLNLPYLNSPIKELEEARDIFEENYIDAIKHRFVANFFDRQPRNSLMEKLEENAALYFNLVSLCQAYIFNLQRTNESKKSKKQRYRRNKKKNDKKKNEDLKEKRGNEISDEEDKTERVFYQVVFEPKENTENGTDSD